MNMSNIETGIRAKFQFKLLHPRYWGSWFAMGLLRLLVLLPYCVYPILSRPLGRMAKKFAKRRVSIARTNLRYAFPNETETEIEQLVDENFYSTAMAIFETGMAWFWSDRRIKKRSKVVDMDNILNERKKGNSTLIIGMHFLTLELAGRILGMEHRGVGVYRPNNNPVLDYVQLKGRLRSCTFMLDRYDIKGIIRALKQGELVWYAPDHDYGAKNSVFAPFFSVEQTGTTIGTLLLVRQTQASLIPFTPIRDEHGFYTISVCKPLVGYPQDDKEAAAAFMNKAIEDEILRAPTQYMWLHRRFKTRPEGMPSLYDDGQ